LATCLDQPVHRFAAWMLLACALATAHQAWSEHFLYWEDFLDFKGEHPFQSRVLPILMAKGVFAQVQLSRMRLMGVFWAIDLLSLLVAIFAMWRLARLAAGQSALTVVMLWAWQVLITFVVSRVHNWYYVYDMPSLAFMAVGLWMIWAEVPFAALAAWTVLAMFNRESAVLLPIWYLAFHGWRPTAWRQALPLLLACVLVRLGLAWALGGLNRMVVPQMHGHSSRLAYNLSFLTLAPGMLHTANVFLAFGGLWLLLWRQGPMEPRLKALLWCLPPFVLLMGVVGNWSELRVFAEFFPVVALVVGCRRRWGVPAS
jgi:hypothetical protein